MKRHAILLVDDEPNIVNALKRSLRDEGYDVYTAHDGQSALELLKRQKIDLIIADQIMPGMTGVELLKLARLRYPDTARIMLTGNANLNMAADAINQGEICCMLVKPWDDTELKLSIQMGLEQIEFNKKRRRMLAMLQEEDDKLGDLEHNYPGISELEKDAEGKILLE
ncbi:MAG: response regulator [Cystobacterineae bacterium]|nr:response regulator [Cystobacterineae bacterium]